MLFPSFKTDFCKASLTRCLRVAISNSYSWSLFINVCWCDWISTRLIAVINPYLWHHCCLVRRVTLVKDREILWCDYFFEKHFVSSKWKYVLILSISRIVYVDQRPAFFLYYFHFITLNAFRRYQFAIIMEYKTVFSVTSRLNASLWHHLVAIGLVFISDTFHISLVIGLLLLL